MEKKMKKKGSRLAKVKADEEIKISSQVVLRYIALKNNAIQAEGKQRWGCEALLLKMRRGSWFQHHSREKVVPRKQTGSGRK